MNVRGELHSKMSAIAVCLGVLFECTVAFAQPAGLAHKPYVAVRSALLKAGLEPVRLKHDPNVDFFCDDGFCNAYPEVLDCSGTGLNPCAFVFFSKKKKAYFIVNTRGETKFTVTSVHWADSADLKEIQQRKP